MPHRSARSAVWLALLLLGCRGPIGSDAHHERGGGAGEPASSGGAGRPGNDNDEPPVVDTGGIGGTIDENMAGQGGSDEPPLVNSDGGLSMPREDGGVGDPLGPPPTGQIGVFVAAGNGGRTVTSCDDGKTWIANHSHQNSNEDHSPFTHKGFAYGNGAFVQLLGWGADSSLKVSSDGVTWQHLKVFDPTFGGIGFDGVSFVVFGQSDSAYASDPSGSWSEGGPTRHGDHLRGGGGGPDGRQRGAVAGGGSGESPVLSYDGGKTWLIARNCPSMSFRNLGQSGGAAFGNGRLVLVSEDGATCAVMDRGASQMRGNTGGAISGKLIWDGEQFIAISETRAFFSRDGLAWTNKAFTPATLEIRAAARSHTGTYVAVGTGGNTFYRSADAVTWTKVNGPGGTELIDVQYGHVKPSGSCAP